MSSGLRNYIAFGNATTMPKPNSNSREERLAEALRANLRRRKAGPKDKTGADEPDRPKNED
jgi:hypothetical protein